MNNEIFGIEYCQKHGQEYFRKYGCDKCRYGKEIKILHGDYE